MADRFPQYRRDGYRPMLPIHEKSLAEALQAGRALYCGTHATSDCVCTTDNKQLDDYSYGSIVIARGSDGKEHLVAMIGGVSNTAGFPKGHADKGESAVDAALREVQEEIGLDCHGCILPDIYVDHSYTFTGRLHSDRWKNHPNYPDEAKRPFCVSHKRVRLYLSVLPGHRPLAPQPGEVLEAKWIPISKAIELLDVSTCRDGAAIYREFFSSDRVRAALDPPPFSIRAVAGEVDIVAMCAIYAPYVQYTTSTWALAPEELPHVPEWVDKWTRATSRGLPWLVAVDKNSEAVVGYCNVNEFRSRGGWRNTCEHGIYTHPEWHRRGLGKALLAACLQACREAGVAALMAVIGCHPKSGAGQASCALHAAMGFEKVGYLRGVGAKLGLVLDCQLMCRYLVPLHASSSCVDRRVTISNSTTRGGGSDEGGTKSVSD
jgi:L-amino acid N-acyltransferase YncA/8-oxo-dGTP pyrophosphatase MutT (NUDIX family)